MRGFLRFYFQHIALWGAVFAFYVLVLGFGGEAEAWLAANRGVGLLFLWVDFIGYAAYYVASRPLRERLRRLQQLSRDKTND